MISLPPAVPAWVNARRSSPIGLVIIVVATILLGLYPILRYGGLWGEIDTNAATLAIRAMYDTGSILPGGNRFVYPNGYTYQVLAVFLMNVSGISLPALHLYASSLLLFVIVVPAWLLYRELTASVRGATLATVLLITQPEFLFVVSRGTHEKFTRALMLLTLYLIAASFRSRHRPARLISMTLAFYLAGYAIVALNNLLSTSFIFGVLLSFIIIWVAERYDSGVRAITGAVIRRLIYIVVIM